MQPAGIARDQQIFVFCKEFAARYCSEREVYNFLVAGVGVYPSPFDDVTICILMDQLHGRKWKLHTTVVQTILILQ